MFAAKIEISIMSQFLTAYEYRQLSAQEETAFILMVLLDEGKSNLPYRLLRCLTSVHFANQYYLKRLFSGYRSLNYNFYRDKFEKEQG